MRKHPWIKWLLTFLAVIIGGVTLRAVLEWRNLGGFDFNELPPTPDSPPLKPTDWQLFGGLARVVDIITVNLAFVILYLWLRIYRDRIWARSWRGFFIFTHAAWAVSYILLLVGRTQWAWNLFGIWSLIAVGTLGLVLINLAVTAGHPVMGVARVVIQQATRLHYFKVVMAATVLLIILLPGRLDPDERLNYRVSFFIIWSLRMSAFMLSLLTALLGCYTITNDLSRKQMYMIAAKPVGRFQYLLGKWVGLALLNAVLCAIVGVGVWLGARMLAAEPLPVPPTIEAMRNVVITENDVLAARVTSYPSPPPGVNLQAAIEAEFEELKRQDPTKYPEKFEDLDAKTVGELQGKALARWHTIEPVTARVYVFKGFKPLATRFRAWSDQRTQLLQRFNELMKEQRTDEARAVAQQINALVPPPMSLRLRMKPKYSDASKDGMLRLQIAFGRQEVPLDPMADDTVREVQVPLSQVDDDGSVTVAIRNANRENPNATHQANIIFKPYEGLEILYTAGTFEGNVVRGIAIHWVRLCFLAMLSLAAGAGLGFPMACLVSLMVYGIAVFSQFASESLDAYSTFSVRDKSKWDVFVGVIQGIWNGTLSGDFGSVLQLIIKLIGDTAVALVPSFGYYNPTPLIADGRMVSISLVGETFLWVGLVWTGACLLIAWLLFRKKELASVTV